VIGQTVPLEKKVARYHGLSQERAILVIGVEAGSPAAMAGMRDRDLLVACDGKAITGIDDLQRLLTDARIGTPTWFAVVRGREKLTLEVIPQEARG